MRSTLRHARTKWSINMTQQAVDKNGEMIDPRNYRTFLKMSFLRLLHVINILKLHLKYKKKKSQNVIINCTGVKCVCSMYRVTVKRFVRQNKI